MKKLLVKAFSIVIIIICVFSCAACEGESKNATKLSFKSALEYDYLKSLDGSTVTINGYLATSSPVDGSFIFLMNMPYQSCPFCVPNTNQLSNTMEVYPKKGDSFDYTNQAVKVVGKLEVADDPNEPFTDKFGYEFSFKIVDAEYTILKAEDLSAEMALWQRFASAGIADEIYRMYDYLNFVCKWNTYFVDNYTDSSGTLQKGYYLYPSDAENFMKLGENGGKDAQYAYGRKEGYFDSIINSIKAIDKDAFSDLIANIESAEALANDALYELEQGNYTYEYKYVEKFGRDDYVYTLNIGEELSERNDALFYEFANWFSSWEM